jgi:hypothetical protein
MTENALDPKFWANAGGSPSPILLVPSRQTGRAALGRLRLPRPMMVSVQISRSIEVVGNDGASADLFATVSWQSGRGTHQADVDIGRGTTFTLSAAESIEVMATATVRVTTTQTISLQCTFGPAAATNPLPAVRTQFFVLLDPGKSVSTAIPNMAKRLRVLCSSPAAVPNLQVEFQDGLVNPATADLSTTTAVEIENSVDNYKIVNNNAGAVNVWAIWELAL